MFQMINPTTELEAVNQLLSVIGESPVNSLDESQSQAVLIAKDEIKRVSRNVQAEGLNFNTEERKLMPDEEKHIYLPQGTLVAEPVDDTLNIVWREGQLYDRDENTVEFDGSVWMRLVYGFDFESLPEHVRQYVVIRAGRIFHDRMVGSELLHQFTLQDELEARKTMYVRENMDIKELRAVIREVLQEGFEFNTDYNYELSPENNKIQAPKDALSIKPVDPNRNIVVREGLLYDRKNQSFQFTKPLKVTVVWFLEYKDLPKYVREYVKIKATRRFEQKVGIPQELWTYTQEDEVRSRSNVLSEELVHADRNFLSDPLSFRGTMYRGGRWT